MNNITVSVIEIFISLIVETVILGGIFTWVSSKANQSTERQIKSEMQRIETQLNQTRLDILSQIKESSSNGIS